MKRLLFAISILLVVATQAQDVNPIIEINNADWVGSTVDPDTNQDYVVIEMGVQSYSTAITLLVQNCVKARQDNEIKLFEEISPGVWHKPIYHVTYDHETKFYTFDGFEELRTYTRIDNVRNDICFWMGIGY